VNSVFASNVENNTDGTSVGITNLNGQVQCDVIVGCLPVCTVCQDEEAPSLPPTRSPTATPTTTRRTRVSDSWPAASIYAGVALSTLCLLASSAIAVTQLWHSKCDRNTDQPGGEDSQGLEVGLLRSPLTDEAEPRTTEPDIEDAAAVDIEDAAAEHSSASEGATTTTRSPNENEERAHTGNRLPLLPWSFIGSSLAPIFAIDRNMRIVSWSQGACGLRVVRRFSLWS
jgi:hypothetical protein